MSLTDERGGSTPSERRVSFTLPLTNSRRRKLDVYGRPEKFDNSSIVNKIEDAFYSVDKKEEKYNKIDKEEGKYSSVDKEEEEQLSSGNQKEEKLSEIDKIEEIISELDEFPSNSYGSNTLPFQKKHKKKWTIKLPWKKSSKQKNTNHSHSQIQVSESPVVIDDMNDNMHSSISEADISKSMDILTEEVPIENTRKKRAFSWYGGGIMFATSKNLSSNINHVNTDGVIDELVNKSGAAEMSHVNEKENSSGNFASEEIFEHDATVESSDEELKFVSDDDNKKRESSRSDIALSSPLHMSKKQTLPAFGFATENKKEPKFKKRNSLPNIFFKKNKKKKIDQLKEGEKSYVNYKENAMDPPSPVPNTDNAIERIEQSEMLLSTKNLVGHSVENMIGINSAKEGFNELQIKEPSKSFSQSSSKSSIQYPLKTSPTDQQCLKFSPQQSIKTSIEQPIMPRTLFSGSSSKSKLSPEQPSIKQPSKFSDKSVQLSRWLKNDWSFWDDLSKPKSSSNDSMLSDTSSLRIRRKSYEEMILMMEREMFDDEWSDDDSSDTDGDEVDLSFNKQCLKTGYNFQKGPGYKPKEISKLDSLDRKSSSDEAELVLQVKVAAQVEKPMTSTYNGENKTSPNIVRPLDAPPLPPSGNSSSLTGRRQHLDSSDYSGDKMDIDKQKRKRFRKTRKILTESDSLPSLEEASEPVYENFPAKGKGQAQINVEKELLMNRKTKSSSSDSRNNNDSPTACIPTSASSTELKEGTNIYPSSKDDTKLPVHKETMDAFHSTIPYESVYSGKTIVKNSSLEKKEKEVLKNVSSPRNDSTPVNWPLKTIQSVNAYRQSKCMTPPTPPSNPPPENDPFEISSTGSNVDHSLDTLLSTSKPEYNVLPSNLRSNLLSSRGKNSETSSLLSKTHPPPTVESKTKNVYQNAPYGYERKNYFVPQTKSISSHMAAQEVAKQLVSFTTPLPVENKEVATIPSNASSNSSSKDLPTQYQQCEVTSVQSKSETETFPQTSHFTQKDETKISWSELYNELPRPSPLVQRQILAMKQESLRLADDKKVTPHYDVAKNYKKEAEILRVSKALSMTSLSLDKPNNICSRENMQSVNNINNIPKRDYPLKSILRNSNNSIYQTPRTYNDTSIPCTCKPSERPFTVQVSSSSEQVLPSYRQPVSTPQNYVRTQSFTADEVERIEITDSSSSESDDPPTLPNFPPPPPRKDITKLKFFESLIQQPHEKPFIIQEHEKPYMILQHEKPFCIQQSHEKTYLTQLPNEKQFFIQHPYEKKILTQQQREKQFSIQQPHEKQYVTQEPHEQTFMNYNTAVSNSIPIKTKSISGYDRNIQYYDDYEQEPIYENVIYASEV